jgi:phosphoribosylformimino-5-aminoimidazole carboxamide ribotide isomerase
MMELIPAIDLIDGKCVRLTEGDYSRKIVYNDDPLEVGLRFQDSGIRRLHLVDLDGAKAGKIVNWKVLETLASKTDLQIDFGGGVKTEEDVHRILGAGARWVTVGSLAARNPEILESWMRKHGADIFFLGADVRDKKIATGGWLETTDIDVFSFIGSYVNKGLTHIFCTDISKDGRLEGPAVELYQEIIAAHPSIQLVASGGVSNIDDLHALAAAGCHGAIIGKAIYEGRITLEQLKTFHA